MSGKTRFSEVPLQDYARIQLMFLPNALSKGKLFTDLSFPPDKSSLTYVYSGDDRYEKMVFKRPKVSGDPTPSPLKLLLSFLSIGLSLTSPYSSVDRAPDLKTRGFGFDSRAGQPNKY